MMKVNTMKNILIVAAAFCVVSSEAALTPELAVIQAEELRHSIRPGDPEKGVPFWNNHSPLFIYPPAFDFKTVEKAENYRFRIYDAKGRLHSFVAEKPWASLEPVWSKLAYGQGTVICEAMWCSGKSVRGFSGMRVFWKAHPYEGQGPARARSYREAALKGYEYVFAFSPVKKFLESGAPDKRWFGFGYPSKTYASIISAMARYMKLRPEGRPQAMKLASLCVAQLEKDAFPADSACPGCPRTYTVTDGQYCVRPQLVDKVMLLYPLEVGMAFLDLYGETRDASYLEKAEDIAAFYFKTRRADGTWPLMIEAKNGKPYGANLLVPDTLMLFFRSLAGVTGKDEYRRAEDGCLAWIDEHPMKDWYWEGQFEDVEQRAKYLNLTGNSPRRVAMYLLERFPGDPVRLAQARDLVRFAEDQFVLWEYPYNPADGTLPLGPYAALGVPCRCVPLVCEQYDCYLPVNASAASMFLSWSLLGKATGNALDIAKAKSMADKMTAVQLENGCIPTWWRDKGEIEEWVNCQVDSAISILRLPIRRRAHLGATLNVTWDDASAVALLAADCETRVEVETDLQGGLVFWAGTEPRCGLATLSAALVVKPKVGFLDAVDAFEADFGLPRGVASRRRADIATSCYYVPTFRQADMDLHLAAATKGGFGLFMLDVTDLVKTTGTYEFTDEYPNGLSDIAALGERIRAAGLRTALHGFSTKVHFLDPLATTNLDARLNAVCGFVLARSVAEDETTLLVEGNPGLLRREPNRRILAVGRELIEFSSVGNTAEAGITLLSGCRRGIRGTAAARHEKGECLNHLDVDDWPIWIRANPNTSMPAELADRIAAIWKAFGAVMFYFDGAEDVPPPYWHHVPRAQYVLYERLDPKPIFCETALKSHFGWHINSRGNAFDIFSPGRIQAAMRACNLRCAARDADDFTCVDFGWLNLRLPEAPKPERANPQDAGRKEGFFSGMQPDHFEYVFSKALAWNSPVTVQFSRKALTSHPHIKDCLTAMGRWEQARRESRFATAECVELKDPDKWHSLLDLGSEQPELVSCLPVTMDSECPLRAYSFVRQGESGIVYWDMLSSETPILDDLPCAVRRLCDGDRRILLSSVSRADLVHAFLNAVKREKNAANSDR